MMRFRLVARLAGMGVPGEFWREVSNCESEEWIGACRKEKRRRRKEREETMKNQRK